MKNQEVIKYACALTGNQQGLLEFVYKRLTEYILKQTYISKNMFDSESFFLKSLVKEVSDPSSIDPLHNQHINYITQGDVEIFIPSKLYVFGPATSNHQKMKYIRGDEQLTSSMLHAECVMKLGCHDQGQYATEVLKILHYIKTTTGQQISIAHLDWKHICMSCEFSHLALQTLKISKNLRSICMWTCKIPKPVYDHLVSQLQYCDNLKRLDLSECQSVDIGKAIAASKSLSDVYLYDSVLSPEAFRYVAYELCKHKHIKQLHLVRTKGVPVEMAHALSGMKSLQVLHARRCNINISVAEQILKSLTNCRELEELQLGVNHLTGCITHLFPLHQSHSGYSSLKSLSIYAAHLNQQDVNAICDAVGANKLPRLEHLNLSFNSDIAHTLGSLLNGTNHPGFPFLMYFDLMRTRLTDRDLLSIAEAVEQGRLPKLRRLNLGRNELSRMEHQIRILVEKCVSNYKKLEVTVQVFNTKLSETFLHKLQSICQDSVVRVENVDIRRY